MTLQMDPSLRSPLALQRALLVERVLSEQGCVSVVDAGCGDGKVLSRVLCGNCMDRQLRHVVAIDANEAALRVANANMTSVLHTYEHLDPVEVSLVRGNLCTLPTTEDCNDEVAAHVRRSPASLPRCIDAVVSIEVMEHIPPHEIPHFTEVLFAELGAARGASLVLVTTPNRSENKRLHDNMSLLQRTTGMKKPCWMDEDDDVTENDLLQHRSIYDPARRRPWRRHKEHTFELTPDQFQRYCEYVVEVYGSYWQRYQLLTDVGNNVSHAAVFYASKATTPTRKHASTPPPTQMKRPFPCARDCSVGSASSACSSSHLMKASLPSWSSVREVVRMSRDVLGIQRHRVMCVALATAPRPVPSITKNMCAANMAMADDDDDGATTSMGAGKDSCTTPLRGVDREARMQRFPFEAVFGMRWDDYVAEFLVDDVAERGRDDDGARDTLHDQHRYGHLSCSVYENHSVVSATLRDLWQMWCSSVYAAVSARRGMGPDYSSMPVCVAELPQLIRSPWEASVRHLHRCLCQQYAAWEGERLSSSRTAAVWLSWHGTGVRHVVQNLYAAAFDPDDVQRTLPSDDEMYETCASLRGYTREQRMELQHVLFSLANVTCSLLVLGQLRQRLQRDLQDVTRCYSKCSAVLPEHVHLVVAYLAAVDVLGGTMAWWRECVLHTRAVVRRRRLATMVSLCHRDDSRVGAKSVADVFLRKLAVRLGSFSLVLD